MHAPPSLPARVRFDNPPLHRRARPLLVAGFLVLAAPPAPAQGTAGDFEIAPYLTDIGPFEAVLNWRTRAALPSTIRYGTSTALTSDPHPLPAAVQHGIRLTGLLPDTVYHYEVDNAFRGSFRTLAEGDDLTFVAIGHTHGSETFDHYPDALLADAIRNLDPDFVIHAGDTTYFNTTGHFDRYFFDLFADLLPSRPVYVAPGNHDAGWPFYAGLDLQPFKELLPFGYPPQIANDPREAFFRIDKGDIRFFFLSYSSDLRPGSPQRNWLAAELATSTQRLNAVVFGGSNNYYDAQELLTFLSTSGVDFVIRGDGAQPSNPLVDFNGMPMYFVGTGSAAPHRLLRFESRAGVITVTARSPTSAPVFVDRIPRTERPPRIRPRSKGTPPPPPEATGFGIRPYATHLAPTEATLSWRLDSLRPARFRFGRTLSYELQTRTLPARRIQTVRLSGLQPDSLYQYEVDAQGGWFRTPRDDPEMSFVAVGTEEFDNQPDTALAGAVARLQPDFLLHVSNATWNGGIDQLQNLLFGTYAAVPLDRVPLYTAPGNHADFELFREVFPYRYTDETEKAHYSMVQADTRFLFLSLAADLGPGSAQRAWIAKEVAASGESFQVAVLGGTQPVLDEELFSYLAGTGIDFVIRGDVQQPADPVRIVEDMPMYFVGTGSPRPHELLLFEHRDHHWTVKQVSPDASTRLIDWVHDGVRRPAFLRLDPAQAQWSTSPGIYRGIFSPAPAPDSLQVGGLQLRLDLPSTLPAVIVEAYVRPRERNGTTGIRRFEFGFRSQWTSVDHDDGLVTIPLVQTVPGTSTSFHIEQIMLRFLTSHPLTPDVLAGAWLYPPR